MSTAPVQQLPSGESAEEEDARMSLIDHLRELRHRVVRSLQGLFIAFIGCYYYSEEIFELLQRPLAKVLPDHGALVATSVAEGFLTNLRVGFIAAFFAASPVFFYQAWRFIAPGLYPSERKLVIPFVFSASTLFLFGAGFGYFAVFPFVFDFFI